MDDVEFQRVLVVSTRHIPEAEARRLERQANAFSHDSPLGLEARTPETFDYGLGVLLYVYPEFTPTTEEKDTVTLALKNMCPELLALYALAQTHECSYLKLDREGPVMRGYPTFDW